MFEFVSGLFYQELVVSRFPIGKMRGQNGVEHLRQVACTIPLRQNKLPPSECYPNRHRWLDYLTEIFGTAQRNAHIKPNPAFPMDYHIVRIGIQSMKRPQQEGDDQISPIQSLPKVNNEDEHNQFNKPQTYRLALEFELSDPCQNCHYIPAPSKIWSVRLKDNRQVKLCLGCLLLLTKISMSRQQEEVPFNNQQNPCSSMRKRRSSKQNIRKRRSPNTKCIRFPPDQIDSITAFSPSSDWNMMEQEEYGQDDCPWPEEDRKQWSGDHQPSYLQKLKAISGMIVILLVGLYRQIFKD